MNNLLLEIGTEEIPAGYIAPALNALASNLQQRLTDARIDHGEALVYGTPRRLAIIIKSVAPRQKSVKSEIIGPPATVGYDRSGHPTMAAQKFAEKVGVPLNRLILKETPKGAYLCAAKTERGLATRNFLKETLPQVILSLPFPKKMRWADLDLEFARPIQTILALLGKAVVQFQLGNLKSGRYTFGHNFMAPGRIKLDSADAYIETLRSVHVVADRQERKAMLERDIATVAEELGGRILADTELVDINSNLVEYPVAVVGRFDEKFLEVPNEVLINAMREHQKYFAVIDANDKLMPCFIAINNTIAKDMAVVAKGHERVLRARLADARFFYQGDLAISNDERVEMLKRVLFQADLGTLHAKAERITKIGELLAEAVTPGGVSHTQNDDLKGQVVRAALLSKADLVSQVVGEFPKLQGIMGRIYAAASGEPPDVAAAIEEHYRPVYSGALLPQTLVGAILSIADKIDTICGCFSVGLIPTGASDPYALRRQGIGILQIMLAQSIAFPLSVLVEASLKQFQPKNLPETKAQVLTFLQNRMANLLVEGGFSKDTVAAVLSVTSDHVPDSWRRADALERLKAKPDFEPLAVAFKRVVNIIKKAAEFQVGEVNPDLFENDAESALLAAFESVKQKVEAEVARGLFEQALAKIATLRDPVDAFFNAVMVMADDAAVRHNRLSLLSHIAALFENLADFSKLSA
jgi:glycyl-tRNA synthetase beta chain